MISIKRGALAAMTTILLCMGCTKPTNDIKVVIDANVIKYSALIYVTDADDNAIVPARLTLNVSGADASQIYELSGQKTFTFADGIIAIGPGPMLAPTAANPVTFMVTIAAPGYKSLTENVQINAGEVQQVISVSLAKTTSTATGGATVTTAPPSVSTSGTNSVSLNFTGTCQNNGNIEVKPSNYIFYRVSGTSAAFQYLGYMNAGVITVPLVLGSTYDFKFVYDGQTYIVTQKVEDTNNSATVNLGTVICSTF